MTALIVVVVVAAVAALAWVLAPLLHPETERVDAGTLTDEAAARKLAALTAILELEDDRSGGKLADADFRALKRQYEAEAVVAMAELDALEASGTEPDELEAEIARVRRAMTCPACGAIRPPDEGCPRCGAA